MPKKSDQEKIEPWINRNLLINRCSKCGADQDHIDAKYHSGSMHLEKLKTTNGTECITDEHLHCICMRCG